MLESRYVHDWDAYMATKRPPAQIIESFLIFKVSALVALVVGAIVFTMALVRGLPMTTGPDPLSKVLDVLIMLAALMVVLVGARGLLGVLEVRHQAYARSLQYDELVLEGGTQLKLRRRYMERRGLRRPQLTSWHDGPALGLDEVRFITKARDPHHRGVPGITIRFWNEDPQLTTNGHPQSTSNARLLMELTEVEYASSSEVLQRALDVLETMARERRTRIRLR